MADFNGYRRETVQRPLAKYNVTDFNGRHTAKYNMADFNGYLGQGYRPNTNG